MQTTSVGRMSNLMRNIANTLGRNRRARPRTGDRSGMRIRTTTLERWKREAAERVAWGEAHPKPERKSRDRRKGKRPNARQKRRGRYLADLYEAGDDPVKRRRIMGRKQRIHITDVVVTIGGVRFTGFDQ